MNEYSNYPLGIASVITCILIFIVAGVTAQDAIHFWGAFACIAAKVIHTVSQLVDC